MHIFRFTLGALALQAASVISVAIEQLALEVPHDIQARGTIATTATTPTTLISSVSLIVADFSSSCHSYIFRPPQISRPRSR